jgi:hypothetical protein
MGLWISDKEGLSKNYEYRSIGAEVKQRIS